MWLSCLNCFYGLSGQEKPWCFIFSAKLRYEEDFLKESLEYFISLPSSSNTSENVGPSLEAHSATDSM
jgi:hypothetical protein